MLTEPSGLVSVMPQPWITVTSCLSRKSRIIWIGTAEPPITVRFNVCSLPPVWSRYASSIIQTVGTAAASVTLSSFISCVSVAASPIFGPGNTSLAPVIGALYGRPHAFA